MLADSGVMVEHTTLFRRIQAYAPELEAYPSASPDDEWLLARGRNVVFDERCGPFPQHEARIARTRRKTEVCDVDSAPGLSHAPQPRSDGIKGHPTTGKPAFTRLISARGPSAREGSMTVFFGIDVAKERLDCAAVVQGRERPIGQKSFPNTPDGIERAVAWVMKTSKAAKRLLTRLMRKQGMAPRHIVTDKLSSYGAARRQVMPSVEHRSHKGLNNRAENSHLPLAKRERMMQGFQSVGGLQRFTSVISAVSNLFVPPHSRRAALATHLHRLQAIAAWKPRRACSPEFNKAGLIATSSGYRDITGPTGSSSARPSSAPRP
ncbi:hypothetical protein MicloDRAFT_00013040 [Microvirga lotononidis]|uniref:DDE domain-containing protein n=1 Tax=Microvirga lotononidis TaxID=864069 RepID=I4Z191_9HYPH|nr:hypothetical protein MicloDRAFT_00013040 [Microvirga lotononidis]